MNENDVNTIIQDLHRRYLSKGADTIDYFAVAYILFKRAGMATMADQTLIEMKEIGIPSEWMSLIDGVYMDSPDIEKRIKSLVGVINVDGKVDWKTGWKTRGIPASLIKVCGGVISSKAIAHAYTLCAIYALTGKKSEYAFGAVPNYTIELLPSYVKWIEDHWR